MNTFDEVHSEGKSLMDIDSSSSSCSSSSSSKKLSKYELQEQERERKRKEAKKELDRLYQRIVTYKQNCMKLYFAKSEEKAKMCECENKCDCVVEPLDLPVPCFCEFPEFSDVNFDDLDINAYASMLPNACMYSYPKYCKTTKGDDAYFPCSVFYLESCQKCMSLKKERQSINFTFFKSSHDVLTVDGLKKALRKYDGSEQSNDKSDWTELSDSDSDVRAINFNLREILDQYDEKHAVDTTSDFLESQVFMLVKIAEIFYAIINNEQYKKSFSVPNELLIETYRIIKKNHLLIEKKGGKVPTPHGNDVDPLAYPQPKVNRKNDFNDVYVKHCRLNKKLKYEGSDFLKLFNELFEFQMSLDKFVKGKCYCDLRHGDLRHSVVDDVLPANMYGLKPASVYYFVEPQKMHGHLIGLKNHHWFKVHYAYYVDNCEKCMILKNDRLNKSYKISLKKLGSIELIENAKPCFYCAQHTESQRYANYKGMGSAGSLKDNKPERLACTSPLVYKYSDIIYDYCDGDTDSDPITVFRYCDPKCAGCIETMKQDQGTYTNDDMPNYGSYFRRAVDAVKFVVSGTV